MALKSEDKHLQKIPGNEEIFVLRGQDMNSPRVILMWIEMNLDVCPEKKLREAFECALRMRKTPNRKYPD